MVKYIDFYKYVQPISWHMHKWEEKPNDKLGIYLDPRDLNTAIKRPHYPMSTFEEALSKV